MKKGYIFTEEIKNEMLDLRKKGYSYSALAKKYDVDHSTIMYHCKHAGITLSIEDQEKMFNLIREGVPEEQIALQIGVSVGIVEFYHTRYGCVGTRNFWKTSNSLAPLEKSINIRTLEKEKLTGARNAPTKYKIDKRGVEWRLSKWGEWICLGMSDEQMKIELANKKKKEVEKKRLEMLMY